LHLKVLPLNSNMVLIVILMIITINSFASGEDSPLVKEVIAVKDSLLALADTTEDGLLKSRLAYQANINSLYHNELINSCERHSDYYFSITELSITARSKRIEFHYMESSAHNADVELQSLRALKHPFVDSTWSFNNSFVNLLTIYKFLEMQEYDEDYITNHLEKYQSIRSVNFPFFSLIRGDYALKRSDANKAIEYYRKVINIHDEHKKSRIEAWIEHGLPRKESISRFVNDPSENVPVIERCEAYLGIARAIEKQRKYQVVVDSLLYYFHTDGFSDDAVFLMGKCLIKLGRVNEAKRLFQITLELNPCHLNGHYYLGNGYTRYNYSELKDKYKSLFPDNAATLYPDILKNKIDSKNQNASEEYRNLVRESYPDAIEPMIFLASHEWERGNLKTAEWWCYKALLKCPEYGRAHAILAKIYETHRMSLSIFHNHDDSVFAATQMPEIRDIEKYVINWNQLSPRHQKRVAMSLEPWRQFIPALAATGNTLYIKPLYEILSEVPFLQSLRDQRIGLDGRLWDDVRGVGGQHTVTGIEDVERSIYGGYNTVLHEVSHQVHYLLTEPEKQQIEQTFRNAKSSEAEGNPHFMSRYQSLTVWEYFAEGVNAYFTPRRNEYDSKEILRERLFEMDTSLVKLVERFISIEDMTPYYTIGLVNSAYSELEGGNAASAIEILNSVSDEEENESYVLNAKSYVYSLLDMDSESKKTARNAIRRYPDQSSGYLSTATAIHYSGDHGLETEEKILLKGLQRPNIDDENQLYLRLGDLYWEHGRYGQAIVYYDSVRKSNPDNPEAIWGLANSLCDSSLVTNNQNDVYIFEKGRGLFDKLIEKRSGNVDIRLSYMRVLLQNDDLKAAEEQLKEAISLYPKDQEVKSYRLWLEFEKGNLEYNIDILDDKRQQRDEDLTVGQYIPDLTEIIKLLGLEGSEKDDCWKIIKKDIKTSNPEWFFNSVRQEYTSINEFPDWLVRLSNEIR